MTAVDWLTTEQPLCITSTAGGVLWSARWHGGTEKVWAVTWELGHGWYLLVVDSRSPSFSYSKVPTWAAATPRGIMWATRGGEVDSRECYRRLLELHQRLLEVAFLERFASFGTTGFDAGKGISSSAGNASSRQSGASTCQ